MSNGQKKARVASACIASLAGALALQISVAFAQTEPPAAPPQNGWWNAATPPAEEAPPAATPAPPEDSWIPAASPSPEPMSITPHDPVPSTLPAPTPVAPVPSPAPAPGPDAPSGHFEFGSYGRVITASNLRGGTGTDSDIVTFGPRIDESTYAELELRRDDHFRGGIDSHIVATLAIAGPLFHFDGNFDARLAVRNLYAEELHAFAHGLSFWGGSRMVRGDDIYLIDLWPLDNLNMVGGGSRYAIGDQAELGVSVGLARPNNPFYVQTVDATAVSGFLPAQVLVLDRPRVVVAAKGTYWLSGRNARRGLKLVLYGEGHHVSAGTRRTDMGDVESLPQDGGALVGAQLGAYDADSHTFANLFLRYAEGLAAYDPLGIPFSVGSVISTARSREVRLAFSANFESGPFAIMAGGLFRYFRDADPTVLSRNALSEGVILARPMVWIGNYFGLAGEVSFQHRETSALDDAGNRDSANLWKLGLIPFISPGGRGSYTRPHIRLIYAATLRDAGARRLYSPMDARSSQTVEHFFGVGVEWWFNSTSYQ